MTTDSMVRALASAQAWLAGQDQPESAISACEAGLDGGESEARRWVQRVLNEQEDAGSWCGALLDSAEALLALHELRTAGSLREQDPGVARALDWLRTRQSVDGAWTDGCSPERHERGFCHHFTGGFFSPGPPEVPFEEAWLANGLRLGGDTEIRFVSSTVALRAALVWNAAGADAALHLEGLRRVVREWQRGYTPAGLSSASLLSAVHTLLCSDDPHDRDAAERGLTVVAGKQRGDGSWVDADAFQALEVFGAAVAADVASTSARRALWHGARLLVASQQSDGSWGRAHGARRALIAWRIFRLLDPEAA